MWIRYKRYLLFSLALFLLGTCFYLLPESRFQNKYSTVLEDQKGNLIGAAIAQDGQWRFPQSDSVTGKFQVAITHFEDQYFFYHLGFNPVSLLRAAWQNFREGKVVSGGSTLTMQVVRLSRGKDRTLWEKCKEILLAIRLELATTKNEILSLYAAHAPFGGNIVGIEAAAWRYFGRPPQQLSWAENAVLAVLPNSPSLIYPGKNQEILKLKRDKLLLRLFENQVLDTITYQLALSEPLPGKPKNLPNLAPHLLARAIKEGRQGNRIKSTLDINLQTRVNKILDDRHRVLKANAIHNGAVVVLEVKTGNCLAYVGNIQCEREHNPAVDVVTAPRSTGSVLKPILYAAMLDEGMLLPKTLIPDIPTIIDGFAPRNFDKKFEGAVPADQVVARSLNVPSVHMLRNYGVEKFHFLLQKLGLTTLTQPPGHYGLSLILGGAEGTLWDLCGVYAGMARTLNNFFINPPPYRYSRSDYHTPNYSVAHSEKDLLEKKIQDKSKANWLSASAVWFAFKAMQEVVRPEEETGWEYYSSIQQLAWKTGTSFGFRDGWAFGLTPDYVIGVWVGNADGEGRPGLTGTTSAAPILFDIAQIMPKSSWFSMPGSELAKVKISKASGYRASLDCPDTISMLVPRAGLNTVSCPYHHLIHLDKAGKYQVDSSCEPIAQMRHANWFVLPPVQEWYYKNSHSLYKPLPPFRQGCGTDAANVLTMDMIYPKDFSRIYVPRELDGERGKTVFEATHRNVQAKIFWHLDNKFIGTTSRNHQFGMAPPPGWHTLTLVDENGEILIRKFEILNL